MTWRVAAALVLAVLLLHALLLRELGEALPNPAAAPRAGPQPIQTRALLPSPLLVPSPLLMPPTVVEPPATAPTQALASPARPAPPRARPTLPAEAATPPATVVTERAAPPSVALAVAADVAGAPAMTAVPVYRTRVPPEFTLDYELRRGGLTGSGELQWRPGPERYEARLEGRVLGVSVMVWHSQGGFDAAGLAPLRYTDWRRGRATQAANFQREAGKVTFSGPATEHALAAGAQDRLSWMVQLAAIAEAEPALAAPGGRIALFVVGARGDADVWTFDCVDAPALALPGGTATTLHWLREPRKAYDSRVEVWLDPARHHLPVRARLGNGNDGDVLELLLR